ncbi:Choline transport protein [Pseudocercospora fuligena]|uniref:Choline transport protein n=1 Tax=Pseudocercospora fuligena TaxID=685502 RepID=A0A8H6VJ22_9PEZI|nr:Choline transport protein [Pseudocercospora fuligena]
MASPTSSSSSAQPAHLSEDVITKTNVSRTSRELGTFDRMVDDGDDLDYHGHLKSSRQGDKGFTKNDQKDMKRMGKEQELRRNFRGLSTIAFTVILQGTWEVLLAASYQGMYSGGLAGLFWSYIWTFIGFSLVVVSLAEMASMAPTSGGQYHWVSEFAPPKYQKLLSYFTGWMSTLSWQAGTASGPFLVGTLIQSLAYINHPEYSATNWQGTLCVWAITLIVLLGNVYGGNAMPVFQNLMLILHVFGFLTIIVCIWVLAPRNSAEVVFTQFYNGGNWSSMGLALMVGQISAIYACICSDAAAHMSEEIKDAGRTVPKAMIGSYVLNGGLGIVFLVTFLFSVVDLEGALNDDTGYPFLYVFQNAFSLPAVNALASIVIVLIFAGTLSYNLSTSRQTWSFARDQGLPFSNWLSKVNVKLEVPANAVVFTCAFTVVLSFINFGSDVAFNAIISLNLVSLMITYQISIACVLYRRIYQPELLPKARWSLGKWGVAINTGGLAYSTFCFFWCFWPNVYQPSLVDFNWSVLMFIVVAIIAAIDWVIRARHVYKGPVVLVEGWRGQ